jgi:predicted transcriptional regulator
MKKVESKTKVTVSTVRISSELNKLIGNCARENNVSKSRVINQAVTDFFK